MPDQQPDLPLPDRIVHYEAYSRGHANPSKTGALFVYGDPACSTVALLCAGFPDDHTAFLPFASKLAARGDLLVGVMCLPGYDDRPDDDVPWTSHPASGFSVDETAKSVRTAAKTLRGVSSCPDPELIGIFHDWGVASGTIWAKQVEEESESGGSGDGLLLPDKLVYLDVLFAPPAWAKSDRVPDSAVDRPNFFTKISSVYQLLYAHANGIYVYASKHLGCAWFLGGYLFLDLIRLTPLHSWDNIRSVYGDKLPGLMRVTYQAYMYRRFIEDARAETKRTGKSMINFITLHEDWKTRPILYLYGKQKKASFHSPISLALLQRESAEKRSLSSAVGVEGAGHWMYHQKEEECLDHVLGFIRAENTFRA